jgi:hypothetical protein
MPVKWKHDHAANRADSQWEAATSLSSIKLILRIGGVLENPELLRESEDFDLSTVLCCFIQSLVQYS